MKTQTVHHKVKVNEFLVYVTVTYYKITRAFGKTT